MPKHILTPEICSEIDSRYKSGDRVCDISRDMGVKRSTVSSYLFRTSQSHDKISPWLHSELAMLKELYERGEKITYIAEVVGRSPKATALRISIMRKLGYIKSSRR